MMISPNPLLVYHYCHGEVHLIVCLSQDFLCIRVYGKRDLTFRGPMIVLDVMMIHTSLDGQEKVKIEWCTYDVGNNAKVSDIR